MNLIFQPLQAQPGNLWQVSLLELKEFAQAFAEKFTESVKD